MGQEVRKQGINGMGEVERHNDGGVEREENDTKRRKGGRVERAQTDIDFILVTKLGP